MHVLITGGAGNLSRYFVDELENAGHSVTLFDRVRPEESPAPWSTKADTLIGDLTDLDDCARAVSESHCDAVFHLGGIPFSSEDPGRRERDQAAGRKPLPIDLTFRVNVLGTYNIAEASRQGGVERIVFASSMCVIEGPGRRAEDLRERVPRIPIDEAASLWAEQSYHLSKIVGEETLRSLSRASGIRIASMRMMWVYTPHGGAQQRSAMHLGESAVAPEPGTFAVWEYLDARDAAAAYRLALEADGLSSFEAFYLATDRLCLEEHRALIPTYYPHLAGQAEAMGPDDLILSIRKARRVLGYAPRHSWRGEAANDRVY